MSRLYVGIDPGKTGAIAVIDDGGVLREIHDMPYAGGEVVPSLVSGILALEGIHRVWIEKVGAHPRQGIASTWKFAQGYGTLLGVASSRRLSVRRVTPAKWKRTMKVTAEKGTSRRLACELWPDWADQYRRVKDDGRAEACLIAEYGRRQELRQ